MFRIDRETLKLLAIGILLPFVFFFPGYLPDHSFIMTDFLTAAYPFHKMTESLPLPKWDPYIFGGMPFWGAPHADMFYINQVFRFITTPAHAASLSMLFHSIIAFIFSYLYLRKIGVKGHWSFSLSALYSTATFWTSLVFSGHLAKMSIICMLPGIFWALEGVLEGKLLYSGLLGLFAGITVNAGHAQLMYYAFITALIYSLGKIMVLIKEKNYRLVAKILLLGILSLGISAMISSPFLWNQMEYMREFSVRGQEKGMEFAKSWSLDWADFFSMFYGMFSGVFEKYWGSNPFKINSEYLGAALVFFGIGGFLVNFRNWRVISLSVSAFLLFIFMTAKVNPLFPLFYEYFPMIKLFRAQSMASGVFGFVILALAGHSFKDLEKFKEIMPRIVVGLLIIGILLLVFGKSLTLWGYEWDMQREAAYASQSSDRLISVLKTVIIAAAIMLILRGKSSDMAKAIFIGLVGFGDNFLSKQPFYKTIIESRYFASDEIAKFFQNHRGIYRVVDMAYKPDDNYLVLFGVQFVGGHHGQQMKTYQSYLGCKSLMFNPLGCDRIIENPEILDTLGVRYFIVQKGFRDALTGYPQFQRFADYLSKYSSVYSNGKIEILENPHRFPRFFLLCEDSVFKDVRILDYYPKGGYYKVEFNSPGSCSLVLTENFYPHWKAKVNGKYESIKIFRGTFMSVEVQRGRHTVEFIYDNPKERLTLSLFFAGIGFSLLLSIIGLVFKI